MNARSQINRLSIITGAGVVVLIVAACAIKLRGDEDQTASVSGMSRDANPLAAELARCRTVTSEQTDALAECRRVWAEQRRQFLGRSKTPSAHPNDGAPNMRSPAPAPRKDESRLPQGWPSVPTGEGE
jgi:conjugative transfer region protein TrbK